MRLFSAWRRKRAMMIFRIPNYPDLRGFALHGRCRCGKSGRQRDVHFARCPHQEHSHSATRTQGMGTGLEWR